MPDSHCVVDIAEVRSACKSCSLFHLCLPMHIGSDDLEKLDKIIRRRTPLKRGDHLFHQGDPFNSLFAVRSGSIKTYTATEDGQEQITGFHLAGELLGMAAICNESHPCAAKALETTSVCEIPFERLEELGARIPGLQHHILRVMSREILRDEHMLMLLGKMNADERLASFLLSLSSRHKQRGFSASEYYLSMSRNDIGNYLGLAVETISRLFTRFQDEGLLSVERKHIKIHDLDRLSQMAGRRSAPPYSSSSRLG
ncbi:MAG: transcriptional regulator [Gammaproteobacteria bacterium SG8_47]|nr:MAG: transcriptional regulator [Gammaproteobacteria bacterium SG8_47]